MVIKSSCCRHPVRVAKRQRTFSIYRVPLNAKRVPNPFDTGLEMQKKAEAE